MNSASNPISHHTSHTLANGAASSNQGAAGNGSSADGTGRTSPNESDQDGSVAVAEPSPPPSPEMLPNTGVTDSTSREGGGEDDANILTGVASLSFRRNIANFKIIDSTLREGEQFATASFNTAQKIAIARALDDFGVEYIELTSPAASQQSRADCEAICKLNLKAKILTHIRCNMDDAKIAVHTGVDGINIAIGTSAQLMQHSHGKDMAFIAAKAQQVIEYVQSHNLEVRFSGEDSFRSDFADILRLYTAVDRLGVTRVGIADTVGSATPREVFAKVDALRRAVRCDIETHFHNDTGCAVANAYCALEAGATHIDTTVLGIGERNGITSLGGLMACLLPVDPANLAARYRVEKLGEIEALVAGIVDVEVPFNGYDMSRDVKSRF